jgi:hypothetical protein
MDDKIKEFLTTLKNPRWANESDDKVIEFDAVWDRQQVVFWASPHDVMEYGRDIHKQALKGDFGRVREFIKSKLEEETQEKLKKFVEEQKEEFDKRVAEAVAKALGEQPKVNKDVF